MNQLNNNQQMDQPINQLMNELINQNIDSTINSDINNFTNNSETPSTIINRKKNNKSSKISKKSSLIINSVTSINKKLFLKTNPIPPINNIHIPPSIYNLFNLLIDDPNFISRLEGHIDNILKDGKIDIYDVPEIVYIIVDTYNSLSFLKVSFELIPVLVRLIYKYITDEYDIIPDNIDNNFERLLDSAIKLVSLQPLHSKEWVETFSNC